MTSTTSTRIYTKKKGKVVGRGEGRRKNGAKKKNIKPRESTRNESESQKKKRENDFSSILRKEEDGGLKEKRV
jgi:hypothetical protein